MGGQCSQTSWNKPSVSFPEGNTYWSYCNIVKFWEPEEKNLIAGIVLDNHLELKR